jgi:hypothetical protein
MAVGSSANRTPIKHFLLDALLGMIIGAASVIRSIKEVLLIDCCAGDAIDTEYSGTSSPKIFQKHLDWAHVRGLWGRGFLIEKDVYTVDRLRGNMAAGSMIIIPEDYASEEVAKQIGATGAETTAFVHIDPNHAHDIKEFDHLLKILPDRTTILVTLGCNVGGIKRLPRIERHKMLERLKYLIRIKRSYHSACLVRLERDKAQWAYLLTVPQGWRPRVEKIIRKLEKEHWPKGVAFYWLEDGEVAFWKAAKYLFLKVDGSEETPECQTTSELHLKI